MHGNRSISWLGACTLSCSSCSSYCFRNPGGQSPPSIRARIGSRYFSSNACALGETAESGKNANKEAIRSRTPLFPVWLEVHLSTKGTSLMNNTGYPLELRLFPKFVRISQAIHRQVVRFKLFLQLCAKSLVSIIVTKQGRMDVRYETNTWKCSWTLFPTPRRSTINSTPAFCNTSGSPMPESSRICVYEA